MSALLEILTAAKDFQELIHIVGAGKKAKKNQKKECSNMDRTG